MLSFNWFSKVFQACSPLRKNINKRHKREINLFFNVCWKYYTVDKSDFFSMPVTSNNTTFEIVIESQIFWHSHNRRSTGLLCVNLLSWKVFKLFILAGFNNTGAENITLPLKVIKISNLKKWKLILRFFTLFK